MEDLTRLTNRRRGIISRVRNLLELAKKAESEPNEIQRFHIAFQSLDELVTAFDSFHFDILSITTDENELINLDKIQSEFDDMHYSIKLIYRSCKRHEDAQSVVSEQPSVRSGGKNRECDSEASINNDDKKSDTKQGDSGPNPNESESVNRGVIKSRNIKLPPIEIPKFDGQVKNWPAFYDLFKSLIHNNRDLSNVERYQYLVSSLSKEVLASVKTLPILDQNYNIFFDTLIARYENKRVLLNTYWQSIFNASRANNDALSLRNLLDVFSENLAALDQYKIDMWDFTKFNLLLQKVDAATNKRFEVSFSDFDVPTFDDLWSFLEKQCRALENSALTSGHATSSKNQVTMKKKESVAVMTHIVPERQVVMLATAMVSVKDSQGRYKKYRALLDSASQASFISNSAAKALGITRSPSCIPIQGLNSMTSSSGLGTVVCCIRPHSDVNPTFEVEMLVVASVCEKVPPTRVCVQSLKHIKNIPLADPQCGDPGKIDILLGADIFGHVLKPGLITGEGGEPSAVNTVFGWVLMGKVDSSGGTSVSTFFTSIDVSLDQMVKQFWELEQVPKSVSISSDDAMCEQMFQKTHSRDSDGRYVVCLPFCEDSPLLGESRDQAMRRFTSLESRLVKNPDLYKSYSAFMKDYEDSGHMCKVSEVEKTDEQMYRQFLVADKHRNYQRILWRFSNSEPIQEYNLCTVTYGMKPSPFLAIRCLLQLAEDEGRNYPLATKVVRSDIYVDDIVSGADSVERGYEVQAQLINLFSKGGLELRKWASSHKELLSSIPIDHQQPYTFDSGDSTSLKVLGLQWCPTTDCFLFKVVTPYLVWHKYKLRLAFLTVLSLSCVHYLGNKQPGQ
ncbi:hypothetical protein NQ317_019605 [Molorchus minor]|uniref:Peptidase aspartic putative domain-containing protein n=1 Tax=Molorchus minor TaxID=1323400 RepID=A0ABQ9IPW7_9CUCU|nr:hypothetical protein NQ317_019605 [Molorchus minor]